MSQDPEDIMADPLPPRAAPRLLRSILQDRRQLSPDDLVHAMLGLMQQVAGLHAQGRVARIALDSVVEDADGRLSLVDAAGSAPMSNLSALDAVQPKVSSALKLVGNYRVTQDEASGASFRDFAVLDGDEVGILHPAYITRLRSWEIELGHHDEITDLFQLGMVMASLACGLDPAEVVDLERFSASRTNLFSIAGRLHPVIASLILEATELNRHERATDVAALARRLDTWRDQPAGIEVERVMADARGVPGRRVAVLAHLRDRLFDLSRRNRLVHFRPTQSSINFTDASIPMVMRIESVRADDLCTWKQKFARDILSGKAVPLNRWLRFEDQPQIGSQLDRIIQENRRNRNEYGFSSLRLTVAFLHWHNLKEAPNERISSPLLWLPVEVVRRKGVRDQYTLTSAGTIAEFNPALRHMLRQLYNIELPETVDLSEIPIEAVHEAIRLQIHQSEPGVRLELQTRPAIRLILQRAVQRVNSFNRRRGGVRQAITAKTDFSYSRDDYRPLGRALFERFVRPDPLPQRLAAGGVSRPKQDFMVAETESATFSKVRGEGHMFSWEIDLTSVTLANFNYKKMSLVRDYNALIDSADTQPAFDQVFSIEPRPFVTGAPPPIPLEDQWGVVASDATQDQAVAYGRTGGSYIIQGPPGTGKSQTITNMLADFAGRGLRVLFVCEKRAALDVVHHRLGQAGLAGLATIIHDAQDDKKDFVANLRDHYESWGRSPDNLEEALAARQRIVQDLSEPLRQLAEFQAAVGLVQEDGAPALRQLVQHAAELPPPALDAGPALRETLPAWGLWDANRHMAARVFRAVQDSLGVASLAAHPFAHLRAGLLQQERAYSAVGDALASAESQYQQAETVLEDAASPLSGTDLLAEACEAASLAAKLVTTGLINTPALLDPLSAPSQQLLRDIATIAGLAAREAEARQAASGWTDPFSPADTAAGLDLAKAKEGSFFAFLSGDWRRLRASVGARYDLSAHAVRPKIRQLLEQLAAFHAARAALEQEKAAIGRSWGTGDPDALISLRAAILDGAYGGASRRVVTLAGSGDGLAAITRLAQHEPGLQRLRAALEALLDDPGLMSLDLLAEVLRDLRETLDDLPDLLPHLIEVHAAPRAVAAALTHLPMPLDAIEALVVDETIAARERANPELRQFDIDRMISVSRRAANARQMLRDQNAAVIRAKRQRQFRENVKLSETSLTQLDNDGRAFKKTYATGRRELEHEFGKTMRYKSIRELADGDSGRVVNDLKPIWLMSPLSVSDTLPLDPQLFDVVIFDEASQIPTEDAVPALCRSRQVVIVGDEMQLPPTSFFATGQSDEDMEVVADEDGQRIAIVLDADSLLGQASRNLPATLLAWHYRSRSEALISFSNAAFYAGALMTIPDRSLRVPQGALLPVSSDDEEAWSAATDRLLAAPITAHRMADGVYERRANLPEARYIAGLVRELLARNTGQTIGIVAFSEAQQTEIEDALERLATEDDVFSTSLAREMEREDDGQFTGLFVKNLENVQGDERDIILMSLCYAPGPDGRMVMNFGPINQRGGEKRLNVIFSRAKKHMAIISTIAPEAITNIHNDGARALRTFLTFAEAQSAGAQDHAQAVLATLNPDAARIFDRDLPYDPVRSAVAAALRARGHEVREYVGGASFRCDLAIVDPAGGGYALGILLDRTETDAQATEERFVFRPVVLRAFGWRVVDIPIASWRRGSAQVTERIEAELRRSSWEATDDGLVAGRTALSPAGERPMPAVAGVGSDIAQPEDAQPDPGSGNAVMVEYRLSAGTSNKFWRIGVLGVDVIVEFGRVGARAQRVVKTFENTARADREAQKLILEKTRKGYEEFG